MEVNSPLIERLLENKAKILEIGKYNEEIRKLSEQRKIYYEELDKVRLPIEEKIYDVDVQIGELRQKITQEKKKLYSVE